METKIGPKILDVVPLEFKKLTNADAFKKGINEWKPKKCQCRLCKNNVWNIGFIAVASWAFLTLSCCS